MKRKMAYLYVLLVLVLVCSVLFFGCAKNETNQPNNNPLEEENEPPEEDEPVPANEPQYGGTLVGIRDRFPSNLGDPGIMIGLDDLFALPYAEMLVTYTEDYALTGVLAESFEQDPENKHITFNIRKGVRFHDGTPLNAEAVLWNFERRLETGNITSAHLIESLEVIDEYKIRIHAKEFNSLLVQDWGWINIFSPTAFKEAGNGDPEKSAEWAQRNAIGTGPFILAEFEHDSYIKYVRNDDYWREGYPYLDAIEIKYIPNASTAAAMLQAGEADIWLTGTVEEVARLADLGFKANIKSGALHYAIHFDSADPNSPFADKRVREAVEYAIDREALASMLGQGYYTPLTQMAHPDAIGYTDGYYPRPYNPDKAKQLLADAGYADGLATSIILPETPANRDAAAAIQGYLRAVGIDLHIDLADGARYAAAAFAQGFSGMAIGISGISPTGTGILLHYGPNPQTFRANAFSKSPEFLAYCQEALQSYEHDKYVEAIRLAYWQDSEDAMAVPLFATPEFTAMAPHVHSDYPEISSAVWHVYRDWIEQ